MKNKKMVLLIITFFTLLRVSYAQEQVKTETKTESIADQKARKKALRIANRHHEIAKPNPISRDRTRNPARSHNADRPSRRP